MNRSARNILILAVIALAVTTLTPDRRAGIEVAMQRPGDLAPQKVEAIVDLGLVVFSVLVTWSKRLDY